MAFRPYLFFTGNCRDAFNRYQEIFGGELFIMTMERRTVRRAGPAGDGRRRHPRRTDDQRRSC